MKNSTKPLKNISKYDIMELTRLGNLKTIDLHGFTKEEARAEILYQLSSVDTFISGLIIVHGFHSGKTLQKLVRNEIISPLIKEKIKYDASRTIFLIEHNMPHGGN